jgi:hypothetical protein
MTPPVEYAAMSDAQLRRLDVDTNGLSPASQELRRRGLAAKLGGARRTPAELLRELELRRHPDAAPRDRLIATYARCRSTRDPRTAMLALWATRLNGGW